MRTFSVVFLFAALTACSSGPAGSPAVTGGARLVRASDGGAYRVAPYVNVNAFHPQPELATYAGKTGTLYYSMAFVQSYEKSQCEGAWGGTVLPADPEFGPYYSQQVDAIRSAGGDAILSFGGAAGVDIASVCSTPSGLAKAIEYLVDYYGFTHLDYDIEGNGPYDVASIARRSRALRMVQDRYAGMGRPLTISFTLPVLPAGMPDHVVGVVKAALAAGVKLSIVNVMTMDFGDSNAPDPKGKMGTYAIEAATNAAKQLESIGFAEGANPYASLGITPMIGVNDVSDEVFEPSDASKLVAWAKKNGIGRLSFWAQQRDRTCPGGPNPKASDSCSGIVQSPFEFGKIFSRL